MISTVFAEIDMVTDIQIFSDKCALKELQKLNEVFDQQLKKTNKHQFKLSIWKFIKDTNATVKNEDGEILAPVGDVNENIVSQNPKINY